MVRDRDIENAIDECNRFTKLADIHLSNDNNTEADLADLKRYALDAMRSLRKVRELEEAEAETA